MWVLLEDASILVVETPEDRDTTYLTVRSRSREDLRRFIARAMPGLGAPIEEEDNADCYYRLRAERRHVAAALAKAVDAISYDNFKVAVGRQDPERARRYDRVGSILLGSRSPVASESPEAILTIVERPERVELRNGRRIGTRKKPASSI
jgi:hypothetical protein